MTIFYFINISDNCTVQRRCYRLKKVYNSYYSLGSTEIDSGELTVGRIYKSLKSKGVYNRLQQEGFVNIQNQMNIRT